MNIPKRSDSQYVEVEEFADYELTQCIAYEMAIRDWHYKDLADGAVQYYNQNKESIDLYVSRDESDNYTLEQTKKASEDFYELNSLLSEIDVIKSEYGFIVSSKNKYRDYRLGSEFWDIVDICSLAVMPNEDKLDQGKGTLIHQKDMKEIQLTKEIIRDGYSMDIILSTDDDDCYFVDDEGYPEDGGEVRTIKDYARFIEENGYFNDFTCTSNIRIEENFKRPLVRVEKHKTIKPEITLNMNRPLDELIAYITHVKKDTEKNNLIKLPIELLGLELTRGDNLVCNEKGDKCFDPRSILIKQQKMADMFYIYDCIKEGYAQVKIRNEVYNYYADKGLENITLDPSTLRKYKDIAMEYIAYGKYKEMLSGISVKELDYSFG